MQLDIFSMVERARPHVLRNAPLKQKWTKPSSWRTYNGDRVTVAEITDQHLSNVYWFNALLFDDELVWILDELFLRGSKLLSYQPSVDFFYEIEELRRRKLLRVSEDRDIIDVIFNGEIVGSAKINKARFVSSMYGL